MKSSLGVDDRVHLNFRLSNLGVILLAVGKSLKYLLAAVCNVCWTQERMERTAKRMLQQHRQKVMRGRALTEAVSMKRQRQKTLKK